MTVVKVRVPASTANIGPGFDSFGLALDLWNEAEFQFNGRESHVQVSGEGLGELSCGEDNLILRSFTALYAHLGFPLPSGLTIRCRNAIPISAGLGSSASAILLGLLAANATLGNPLTAEEIVQLGCEIEGHPDNIVSAFWGGLTISAASGDCILTHKLEIAPWYAVVILPAVLLATHESRGALPDVISVHDAVFNIGRSTLVAEALRSGDEKLLVESMQDRLHHPYRLPLIPGSERAIQAAQEQGAPAALSGAGPSVIAFIRSQKSAAKVERAMKKAFQAEGIRSRSFLLSPVSGGAEVVTV